MHYFKFDIAKWVQSTRHLLPEEEGVYLRLVTHYYDTEQPIPKDHRAVLRRLQLLTFQPTVDDILTEYFHLTPNGWIHKKCDGILNSYHKNKKKNKVNGAKGGRPIQSKALSVSQDKPSGLTVATEDKPSRNPNYKLRIKNKELKTSSKKPLATTSVEDVFEHWKRVMNHPKSVMDSKRIRLIREALKMYDSDRCKQAIDGCSKTPHNMGKNDRNSRYDGIHVIFRDSDQIERFIYNNDHPPEGGGKPVRRKLVMPDAHKTAEVIQFAAMKQLIEFRDGDWEDYVVKLQKEIEEYNAQ